MLNLPPCIPLSITVNGVKREVLANSSTSPYKVLRDDLGLLDAKRGYDDGTWRLNCDSQLGHIVDAIVNVGNSSANASTIAESGLWPLQRVNSTGKVLDIAKYAAIPSR